MCDIDLFIKRYDRRGVRSLDITEFSQAFTPYDVAYASMLKARASNGHRALYRRDDVMGPNTIQAFKNMMQTHLKVESECEKIRKQLQFTNGFLVNEAFGSLDYRSKG